MSPSYVKAHIRVDSIELFEANFKPSTKSNPNSRVISRRNSDVLLPDHQLRGNISLLRRVWTLFAKPVRRCNGHYPGRSIAPDRTTASTPAIAQGDRREDAATAPPVVQNVLHLSRGFADRWADWALEPLVDSDFHADSGWTRKHLSDDFPSDKVHTIPTSARILSINGVTELTASILMGSNLALGGDKTLSAKLTLGAAVLRLDAAYRALRVVEGRKSHETNFANSPGAIKKARIRHIRVIPGHQACVTARQQPLLFT